MQTKKEYVDFEIYSENPHSYFSAYGDTWEQAEKNAFKKFTGYVNCHKHEFERRNYTNGVGFCRHCNLFKSKAFEPSTKCDICGIPTDYSSGDDKYYCETHVEYNKSKLYLKWKKDLEELENEDLNDKELKTVIGHLLGDKNGTSN